MKKSSGTGTAPRTTRSTTLALCGLVAAGACGLAFGADWSRSDVPGGDDIQLPACRLCRYRNSTQHPDRHTQAADRQRHYGGILTFPKATSNDPGKAVSD